MVEETKITEKDLQGTWEYSQGHSDKIKYIFSGKKIDFYTDDNWHFEGTFTINGSTLIIMFSDGSSSSDDKISFSGDNLTIISEELKTNATYKRMKSSSRNGCYIATAVYNSYEAPEVLFLRRFRDEVLSTTILGRMFITIYYFLSPPVAERLKNAKRLNILVRKTLDKIIVWLNKRIEY
jgi:hypothetical protein